MKTITQRLTHKALTYSLLTALLSSNAMAGVFAPPAAVRAATTGAATTAAAPAAPAAALAPATAAPSAVAPVAAASRTAERRTLIGVPIDGAPKFEVKDGDKTYIAEAKVVESTLTNPQYGYKDGQYVLIQNEAEKTYKAEISLFDTEGNLICSSGAGCIDAPDVTNQLHNLNAAVETALRKDLPAITKRREEEQKKKEKEEKLLASCKAVRGDDGEIIKISAKNKMEHFEEVLDCHVSRATEDKDADKNDEDLTVAELRSSEIGGLLRRAMTHESSEVRELAKDAIADLEDEFGDTSNSVRSYLGIMSDGAKQLDRLYSLKDQADSNPQARAQILAEMDRAVGAWNPQNFMGKSDAFRAGAGDMHKLFSAISCGTLSSSVPSASCSSDLDKAIGDGEIFRAEKIDDIGTLPGQVDPTSGFKRGQRVGTGTASPTAGGVIYDANQRGVRTLNPTLAGPQTAIPQTNPFQPNLQPGIAPNGSRPRFN